MAAIGGFRSDLSITRKTDGNFGNVSAGVLFSKVRINENGGKRIKFFLFLPYNKHLINRAESVCMGES